MTARQTIRREATRLGVYMIARDTGQPTPDDFDPISKDGVVKWTATILEASSEFSSLRRHLVRKRLKRIVGHYSVFFADAQSVITHADIANSMRMVTAAQEFVQQVANYLGKSPDEVTYNPAREVPGGLLKDALDPTRAVDHAELHQELIRLRKAR